MPNETDNLFKTALDGLPAAPPPGTAFDAEALWGDLDRQLRPRRRVTGWWVAAACGLLTLLAGLGWWFSVLEEKPAVPTRQIATRNVRPGTKRLPEPPMARVTEVAKRAKRRIFSAKPIVMPKSAPRREVEPAVATAPVSPETPPVAPTSLEPEVSPQSVAESVAVVAKPGFFEKKTTRVKPRFRVVHANELPSSETIPVKQPRAEATARVTLGVPSTLQPAAGETPHVFMLTKKPD